MKTIKTLLKELLQGGNQQKDSAESDNQPDLLTQNQNQKQNETETDESAGNSELDNPDAGENPRNNQEEPGGEGNGISETPEEAYRRGVIDGRNQQIEEKYFPKTDDGIPNFRGRPEKSSPLSDIFSMAREA